MPDHTPTMLESLKTISELIAFLVGSTWAVYKIREFRELKQRIGFDVDAEIFPLPSPVTASRPTWKKDKEKVILESLPPEPQTHAIEIRAHFDNRGNRRFRLYNLELAVNTMRLVEPEFDPEMCHVRLTRLHTSGNVVPKKIDHFYIEPGVKQTIRYLALLSQPNELIQVVGEFSLEQHRIFPEVRVGPMGLKPHSAAKTYSLSSTSPPE